MRARKPIVYSEILAKFLSLLPGSPDVLDKDACWEWQGSLLNKGYGDLVLGSKTRDYPFFFRDRSHRFSYSHFVGSIPNGLCVLHKCDNRKCCNPNHLFLGTDADNMRDKMSKGRQAKGAMLSASMAHVDRKGSKNPAAKLREHDIATIYKMRENGYSLRKIGRRFRVSATTINRALKGRTWQHVEESSLWQ